jgi:hypothetical protein
LSRFREKERSIRSQLARLDGWSPSPMDKEAVKSAGWKELGILVVDVNYKGLSDDERNFIENIGNKIYGRRYGR